jgi:isopentenyl-diphosphate Delta-isomerase
MDDELILVDKNDINIGNLNKIKVHKMGKLHRAFSIFIFNSNGELLIQRRAMDKYHSGGLWSNTCCSHPKKNESLNEACHRRLKEEMGFDCRLYKIFDFIYKTKLNEGFYEHEFDHVFIGKHNGKIKPNAYEVMDFKWVDLSSLKEDIIENPSNYSIWFKIIIKNYFPRLSNLAQK